MKRMFVGIALILTVLIVGTTTAMAAPRGYGRGGCGGYGRGDCGRYYYNNANAGTINCPYGSCYIDNNNDGICDNYQNGAYNGCGRGWRYYAQ